jgi:hypothetical protein
VVVSYVWISIQSWRLHLGWFGGLIDAAAVVDSVAADDAAE